MPLFGCVPPEQGQPWFVQNAGWVPPKQGQPSEPELQENEQLPCAQQEDEQALTFRPCTWKEAKALYNITSKLAKPRQALISVLNGLSLEDACKVAATARVKMPNDRTLQQNTYLLFHCKVRGLPKPELAW